MNIRIKELREYLNLTQTEFGKRIGRKLRAIQDYEYGKNKVDESMILLISMTYNVNPDWLRTGIGEMFLNDGRKVSPLVNDIIKKIGKLDNENLLRLVGYIDSLQTLDNKGKIIGGG